MSAQEPAPSGEELQELAYAQDPIAPAGLAVAVITVALTLAIISTITIILRTIVKLWGLRSGVGWDWADTFALLGWVSLSPLWTEGNKRPC